jgi:hypothetical protein
MPEAMDRNLNVPLGTLLCLAALGGLVACGISFSAEPTHASTAQSDDTRMSQVHEMDNEERTMLKASEVGNKPASPTVSVSLVVGGTPIDAGLLPKPPIPIVSVPNVPGI